MGDPDEHEYSTSWLYLQFKTIPEQCNEHVKDSFPPCVQEVARNNNIKSSNMLTHLEPFDLQSIDPPTSYERFLKLIQREKAMLPPKHDSFDYVPKRDFYAIVCKKFSSTMPEVDVFRRQLRSQFSKGVY